MDGVADPLHHTVVGWLHLQMGISSTKLSDSHLQKNPLLFPCQKQDVVFFKNSLQELLPIPKPYNA